jgi:hypothetical protein
MLYRRIELLQLPHRWGAAPNTDLDHIWLAGRGRQ